MDKKKRVKENFPEFPKNPIHIVSNNASPKGEIKMITEINKNVCDVLRQKMQETLDEMGIQGVEAKVGNAVYNKQNVVFKVTLATVVDGVAQTREKTDWARCCYRWGLKKDMLGKIFKSGGVEYKIVGCNPKAHKFPILTERVSDGKRYKHSGQAVKMYFHILNEVKTQLGNK